MRLIDADVLLEQMQPVSEFKINSYAEAAAMAIANAYIKLVENQPTVDTTTHDSIPAKTGKNDGDKTSGDCISRTQAIEAEAVSKWKKEFREYVDSLDIARDDWKGIIEYIDELPSVQPDIIRCKDCKHSRFFDPCFYCYEMGGEVIVPENGFCFKAERKMNATDRCR